MASTPAQNIDTWLRAPYTDAGYLSYTQDQTGTESQQHPGNGVVLTQLTLWFVSPLLKTQRSYDVDGVMAINGSTVQSVTLNMRQAYATVCRYYRCTWSRSTATTAYLRLYGGGFGGAFFIHSY